MVEVFLVLGRKHWPLWTFTSWEQLHPQWDGLSKICLEQKIKSVDQSMCRSCESFSPVIQKCLLLSHPRNDVADNSFLNKSSIGRGCIVVVPTMPDHDAVE